MVRVATDPSGRSADESRSSTTQLYVSVAKMKFNQRFSSSYSQVRTRVELNLQSFDAGEKSLSFRECVGSHKV